MEGPEHRQDAYLIGRLRPSPRRRSSPHTFGIVPLAGNRQSESAGHRAGGGRSSAGRCGCRAGRIPRPGVRS